MPDPPSSAAQRELRAVRAAQTRLAQLVPSFDRRRDLGTLVGSSGLRERPVHRWFAYKEGFSPDLLATLLELLELAQPLDVVDVFGGVATTALSAIVHPSINSVRSVEYSPIAHFIGSAKLGWPTIAPDAFDEAIGNALSYDHTQAGDVPSLSSFANTEIISGQRLRSLLAARDHVRSMDIDWPEQAALLTGIAAVIEDLSGVMKDGRALRIKRGRRRRASSLASTPTTHATRGAVKGALAGQWTAMATDVRALQQKYGGVGVPYMYLRGDARSLEHLRSNGVDAFSSASADLSLFSPPYLNCLDYTELYKLELWLLELVTTQEEFRQTRMGTLRSHPSVKFAPKSYLAGIEDPVVDLIDQMSSFATSHGRRNDVGPTIRSYFDDMYQVWVEQHRILRPGALAACVVANSTFTRRDRSGPTYSEIWRMPVLTDVVLSHLARLAGFESVILLEARSLRPRNAGAGQARESIVVARKGK